MTRHRMSRDHTSVLVNCHLNDNRPRSVGLSRDWRIIRLGQADRFSIEHAARNRSSRRSWRWRRRRWWFSFNIDLGGTSADACACTWASVDGNSRIRRLAAEDSGDATPYRRNVAGLGRDLFWSNPRFGNVRNQFLADVDILIFVLWFRLLLLLRFILLGRHRYGGHQRRQLQILCIKIRGRV